MAGYLFFRSCKRTRIYHYNEEFNVKKLQDMVEIAVICITLYEIILS